MPGDRYSFGPHDRIRFKGATYRPVKKDGREHVFQLVTDGVVTEDHYVRLSDEECRDLFKGREIRVDKAYFSRAQQLLLARGDDSDIGDLSIEEQQTIAWKVEWCTRFERAHAGLDDGDHRPRRTPEDIDAFVEREREAIHRWYRQRFGVPRRLGRRIAGEERKPYDYPGASTLRDWLGRFAAAGHRQEAFRPRYDRCGNRNQLDPRAAAVAAKHVPSYASRGAPRVVDVCMRIDADLEIINKRLPPESRISISERAVRRRIRKLAPVFVDAGRLGIDRAKRKYTPVGPGLVSLDGLTALQRMERVEMDDWEMDLHAVLTHKHVWRTLGEAARHKVNRMRKARVTVRCTVTVGIDVATKCIVGLNVTPFAPSPPGSKSALRSIVVDKEGLAAAAGALSGWPMLASPGEIATDGGPAFRGDFHAGVIRLGIEHRFPGGDPRSRGTVESFFRTFKRFCRKFTGQAFATVVEKGDYPAEEMASLLCGEMQLLLVRFLLDDYHHRPHTSLGGMRPYEAWRRADNDLDPPPDHVQRHIAFGMPVPNRCIDAAGIVFLDAQYVHPEMGLLHGLVGRRRLTIVVDPHDLGSILVLVPADLKARFAGEGDYLLFRNDELDGTTLAERLRENRAAREFERQERLAGAPYRLGAHRALMAASEEARRRAGVPSDEITMEQFERLVRYIERKGAHVVGRRAAPSGEPTNGDDGPGRLGLSVAAPPSARPRVHGPAAAAVAVRASALDTSINMFDDEDDA
jgi:hypothetical protein